MANQEQGISEAITENHKFDARIFSLWVGSFVVLFTLSNDFPLYRMFNISSPDFEGTFFDFFNLLPYGLSVAVVRGVLLGFLQYKILSSAFSISYRFVYRTIFGFLLGGLIAGIVSFPLTTYLSQNITEFQSGSFLFWLLFFSPLQMAIGPVIAGFVIAWLQWPSLRMILKDKRAWVLGVSTGYLLQVVMPFLVSFAWELLVPGSQVLPQIRNWAGYLMPGIVSGLVIHSQLSLNQPGLAPINENNYRPFGLMLAATLAFVFLSSTISVSVMKLIAPVPELIELNYESPLVADGESETTIQAKVTTSSGEPVSAVALQFLLQSNDESSGLDIVESNPMIILPTDTFSNTSSTEIESIFEAAGWSETPIQTLQYGMGCLEGGEFGAGLQNESGLPQCQTMDIAYTDSNGLASITYRAPDLDSLEDEAVVFIEVSVFDLVDQDANIQVQAEILLVPKR